MNKRRKFALTFSCPDEMGLIAKVTAFLAEQNGFILEAKQFTDFEQKRTFHRYIFEYHGSELDLEAFTSRFSPLSAALDLSWEYHPLDVKTRCMLLVSGYDHCLNHLLHRMQSGYLPIEIAAIVSNHDKLEKIAAWHKIPYYHFPVTPDTKQTQESQVYQLIQDLDIDLTILARYMQILSPEMTRKLYGRAINIHHSFLPSFKGAKPYAQAFDRGVKLIGATAHYVSDELDEGPIIEQEVIRVDHTYSPETLADLGKDIEAQVLARAVKFHTERRVFLNGGKTIIFRS